MSWFTRLKQGLQKSTYQITQGLTKIIRNRKLDQDMLDELEEVLIAADLGVKTSAQLVKSLAAQKFDKEINEEEVKEFLAEEITKILNPLECPLKIESQKPEVILVIGVNGSGKTTTIGKLATQWVKQDKLKVSIVAADTFRAAAIGQLETWANRAGANFISSQQGGDAASLAFEGISQGISGQDDVVIIDTAGRLHNKKDLMAELSKIDRAIKKVDPTAPHKVILVLDATIGQNATAQVEAFKECIPLTGLIVTKLDGTAKGGVIVGIGNTSNLPIYGLGVGEGVEDLQIFNARAFSRNLLGVV
jgi:fused signal recognition particle receptor